MEKKIFALLSILTFCVLLTGCEEKKSGPFTMTCTTKKEKTGSVEIQTIVTYKFNEEQLSTEYTSSTTQKFDDKAMYDMYKQSQENAVDENNNENIELKLKSDDDKMQLVYDMTLKNIAKNATTESDKQTIKASKILKTNEERKATCELKGITKEQLKK